MQNQVDIWWEQNLHTFLEKPSCFQYFLNCFSEEVLYEPVLELLKRGGKQLRPRIFLRHLAYLRGNSDDAGLLGPQDFDLALLLELVHTATLIIDDIEDGSLLRRKAPSIHLLYGIDRAINSANAVYFLLSVCLDQGFEGASLLQKHYNRALLNLHRGQNIDILWHKKASSLPSIDEYQNMVILKTGALFFLSLHWAYTLCKEEFEPIIEEYWRNLCLQFQIVDDVKNLQNRASKDPLDDLLEHKKSLPYLLYEQNRYKSDPSFPSLINQLLVTQNKEGVYHKILVLLHKHKVFLESLNFGQKGVAQAFEKLQAKKGDYAVFIKSCVVPLLSL